MAYDNLLYEIEDRIATITLNRPENVNALGWALRPVLGLLRQATGHGRAGFKNPTLKGDYRPLNAG